MTARRQAVQSSRLTQLYSDTKSSLQSALPTRAIEQLPEKISLDRKYRNQKDRLIAWGLEWRDDRNDGDIDRSVEEAGLTEIVESVLENIKDVLDQIERMNNTTPVSQSPYPLEKPATSNQPTVWTTTVLGRYEDLVNDMTSAIDLLCEISKPSRAAVTPPLGPMSAKAKEDSKQAVTRRIGPERPPEPVPAYSQPPRSTITGSSTTWDLMQASDASNLSLTKIDHALLVIPQEGPPTYGDSKTTAFGAASAPIVFGHIRQSEGTLLPVMVEYSRFDRVYRDAGMTLPLARLEGLHAMLSSLDAQPSSVLSRPIAYFEDPYQPRYGLIYEMPPVVRQFQQQTPSRLYPSEPATLSQLLHQTSKLSRDVAEKDPPQPPALEERFRLAQQLVQGFSFLQQQNFAHRNVSSSSVALFPKRDTAQNQNQAFDVRKPLICAVDLFSEYDMDPPPEALQQNIYRHPDDPRIRGPTAALEYEQRFDLYSLSLLLLEIGFWVPLAEIYKEKYSLRDFKLRIEKVWIRKELPQKCGTLFSRCVQDLLQAGDSLGSGPAALTRILDRVQRRLERCCSIDLEDDDFDLDIPADGPNDSLLPAASDMSPSPFPSEKRQLTLDLDSRTDSQLDEKRGSQRKIFTDIRIPDHIQAEYEAFERRLLKIVELALRESKESSWVDIHYSGDSRETAKPSICVGCTSTKRVRTAIKKHLSYNTNLFDLAVVRDSISRSKTSPIRRSQANPDDAAKNRAHHPRPLCGSSIGAWRLSEHSPAVTFGGVVLVDGEPYGLTVHHLLEDPEAEERQATATSGVSEEVPELVEVDEDAEDSDEDSDDELASTLNDVLSIDSFVEEDDDGYTHGIRQGQGDDIILTQPALDDVAEDFFPCEEDRDEDHIDSHRLGHVYASSGLRRTNSSDGVSHEIDWLLMKLDDSRIQPFNVIPGGKRYCDEECLFIYKPTLLDPICREPYPAQQDTYPRRILSSTQLSGLDVHCTGRTSGLGRGKISQRMRWVRFQGRTTFSQVWSASGTFGAGGDSGAWLVSNDDARIAGHVLAYSERFHVAYISPMDVIFEDIRSTLGAQDVVLPGHDAQRRPVSAGAVELGPAFERLSVSQRNLLARHMLHSGNPTHTEREWNSRRSRLGQVAST